MAPPPKTQTKPTRYKAFLDETLTYSCGFYSGRGDSLHQSQLNKLDKMIAAAGIKDGDNVLEIGSGWGSMAIRTAQRFPRVTFTSLTVYGNFDIVLFLDHSDF